MRCCTGTAAPQALPTPPVCPACGRTIGRGEATVPVGGSQRVHLLCAARAQRDAEQAS